MGNTNRGGPASGAIRCGIPFPFPFPALKGGEWGIPTGGDRQAGRSGVVFRFRSRSRPLRGWEWEQQPTGPRGRPQRQPKGKGKHESRDHR